MTRPMHDDCDNRGGACVPCRNVNARGTVDARPAQPRQPEEAETLGNGNARARRLPTD